MRFDSLGSSRNPLNLTNRGDPMSGPNAPSKLYLVIEAGPTAADRLATALATVTPSTVCIAPAAGKPLDAEAVLGLIKLAQAKDIAVLLADDAQLARVTKADGVHLTWSKDIAARASEAREILGNRFILGVDVGRSRHDAMELGETSVDYIAFGIPEHVEDRATATERRLELCDWWAEIFEVPCVAFDVDDLDDAADLADVGTDFIAIRLPSAVTGADLAAFLAAAAAAVTIEATAA